MSPRNILRITVSAISSALCPVTTLSAFNKAAPRSRAFQTDLINHTQCYDRQTCKTHICNNPKISGEASMGSNDIEQKFRK